MSGRSTEFSLTDRIGTFFGCMVLASPVYVVGYAANGWRGVGSALFFCGGIAFLLAGMTGRE